MTTERPLDKPPDNLSTEPSTWTSINILSGDWGVGLTHTENLMIQKHREVRETN